MAVNALLTPRVGGHIFGKDAEAASNQPDSAVRMPTGPSSRYFVEPSLETCRKPRVSFSRGQYGHIVGNGGEPDHTRPHCPALWSARYRTILADSATPHAIDRARRSHPHLLLLRWLEDTLTHRES